MFLLAFSFFFLVRFSQFCFCKDLLSHKWPIVMFRKTGKNREERKQHTTGLRKKKPKAKAIRCQRDGRERAIHLCFYRSDIEYNKTIDNGANNNSWKLGTGHIFCCVFCLLHTGRQRKKEEIIMSVFPSSPMGEKK